MRLTEQSLPFRFLDQNQGVELYQSMRSLVKRNDGLWKSDRQRDFVLGQIQRKGTKTPRRSKDLMNIYTRNIPDQPVKGAVEDVYIYHQEGKFGRHSRNLHYVWYLDDHGIIREVKVHYEYDRGWSAPSGKSEITWERPARIQAQFADEEPEESPDAVFMRDNADLIARMIPAFKDDSFFGKFISGLEAGEAPPRKIWDMMVKDLVRRERDVAPFPSGQTKMEIKLTVERVKYDERETQWGYQENWVLIGDVEGYRELGFIKVSLLQFEKKFGDDEKAPIGKTVLLRGTFNSNGKMIFGSRVSIREVLKEDITSTHSVLFNVGKGEVAALADEGINGPKEFADALRGQGIIVDAFYIEPFRTHWFAAVFEKSLAKFRQWANSMGFRFNESALTVPSEDLSETVGSFLKSKWDAMVNYLKRLSVGSSLELSTAQGTFKVQRATDSLYNLYQQKGPSWLTVGSYVFAELVKFLSLVDSEQRGDNMKGTLHEERVTYKFPNERKALEFAQGLVKARIKVTPMRQIGEFIEINISAPLTPEMFDLLAQVHGGVRDTEESVQENALEEAGPEKSKGHIAFKGGKEYYMDARGELFIAPLDSVIDVQTGYRIGRWEAPAHLAVQRLKMLGLPTKPMESVKESRATDPLYAQVDAFLYPSWSKSISTRPDLPATQDARDLEFWYQEYETTDPTTRMDVEIIGKKVPGILRKLEAEMDREWARERVKALDFLRKNPSGKGIRPYYAIARLADEGAISDYDHYLKGWKVLESVKEGAVKNMAFEIVDAVADQTGADDEAIMGLLMRDPATFLKQYRQHIPAEYLGFFRKFEAVNRERIDKAVARLRASIAEAQDDESLDDVFDNILRKMIVNGSIDAIQDVDFDDPSGSIYLFMDAAMGQEEVASLVEKIGALYDGTFVAASPEGSVPEGSEPADWWVIFVPQESVQGLMGQPEPQMWGGTQTPAYTPQNAVQDIAQGVNVNAAIDKMLTGESVQERVDTSRMPDVIRGAVDSYLNAPQYEKSQALGWWFFRVMTPADEKKMDQWLVQISHPLAFEAGTSESRFMRLIPELAKQMESVHESVDFRQAAQELLDKSLADPGKSQYAFHYRAYLRDVVDGRDPSHLVQKFPGAAQARQDLIDYAGMSDREQARFRVAYQESVSYTEMALSDNFKTLAKQMAEDGLARTEQHANRLLSILVDKAFADVTPDNPATAVDYFISEHAQSIMEFYQTLIRSFGDNNAISDSDVAEALQTEDGQARLRSWGIRENVLLEQGYDDRDHHSDPGGMQAISGPRHKEIILKGQSLPEVLHKLLGAVQNVVGGRLETTFIPGVLITNPLTYKEGVVSVAIEKAGMAETMTIRVTENKPGLYEKIKGVVMKSTTGSPFQIEYVEEAVRGGPNQEYWDHLRGMVQSRRGERDWANIPGAMELRAVEQMADKLLPYVNKMLRARRYFRQAETFDDLLSALDKAEAEETRRLSAAREDVLQERPERIYGFTVYDNFPRALRFMEERGVDTAFIFLKRSGSFIDVKAPKSTPDGGYWEVTQEGMTRYRDGKPIIWFENQGGKLVKVRDESTPQYVPPGESVREGAEPYQLPDDDRERPKTYKMTPQEKRGVQRAIQRAMKQTYFPSSQAALNAIQGALEEYGFSIGSIISGALPKKPNESWNQSLSLVRNTNDPYWPLDVERYDVYTTLFVMPSGKIEAVAYLTV